MLVNQIVRESITGALLKLMKKKDFAEITISELTKVAGVSRVSFYRNFESKEDVLAQHMAQISDPYWDTHHEENISTLWQMTFDIFELLRPTVLLIHKSNIDAVFYRFIKRCADPMSAKTPEEGYRRAMFAGIAFGLYDQWLSTGMKETPDQLSAMFREITLPYVPVERKNRVGGGD